MTGLDPATLRALAAAVVWVEYPTDSRDTLGVAHDFAAWIDLGDSGEEPDYAP